MSRIAFFLLLIFINVFSKEKKDTIFFPYGLAQYRFRWDYLSKINESGNSTHYMNYTGKADICFGFSINIDHRILFHFQFGNNWAQTNQICYPLNNAQTLSNGKYQSFSLPSFHLAFVKWNSKLFSISAGKICVINFGPLDFIERSLVTGNYQGAAFTGWSDATNNSVFGIKFGLPIVKKPFFLSAEFFSTILKKHHFGCAKNKNPISALLIFDFPLRIANFSLTPQISFITNKHIDVNTENADLEYALGFTATHSLNKNLKFTLLCAWAHLTSYQDNYAENLNPQIQKELSYSQIGFEFGFGSSIKCGPGFIVLNSKYSTSQSIIPGLNSEHFLCNNIKYNLIPHPKVIITSQIRFFHSFSSFSKLNLYMFRPEILFSGQI